MAIAIQSDDDAAQRPQDSRADRPALTCVAGVAEDPQLWNFGLERGQGRPRAVAAGVIDENDLETPALEGASDLAGEIGRSAGLVEDGDHHGDVGGFWIGLAGHCDPNTGNAGVGKDHAINRG